MSNSAANHYRMTKTIGKMKFEEKIQQFTFRDNYVKAILNLKYTASWYNSKELVIFKKHGILAQHYNVLRIVKGAHPEAVSPSKILDVMIEPGRDLTRLVDKLVKLGLLARSTCPSNRRRVDIHITEDGVTLTNKINTEIDHFLGSINSLSSEEAEQLSELLDKLRND